MVRLRILGTLNLETGSRVVQPDLSNQPKRLALFILLALQSTRGPIARDKLVGLFWPELSQARARRALSQSLYVIRKSLGEDLVQPEGPEALRVSSELLWCDALEFERALSDEEFEEALGLYSGDLLDGFHLASIPEFEHWLDLERARLRRLAREATRRLIDVSEASGDLAAAAGWARKATQLDASDEEALVRLLRLLGRAGDKSGARREYRKYRDWLGREVGLEPSEAVESAFASVNRENPESATAASGITTTPRPETGSGTEPPAREPRRRARHRGTRAIAALAGLILIFFVAERSQQAPDVGDRGPLPRVLVAPLENHTGDVSLDPVARLAADWLSTEIARYGQIEAIPPVSALRLLEETDAQGDTSEFGRIVAAGESGDADLILGGYIRGTADSAQFEVFALEPSGGRLLFALEPIGSEGKSLNAVLEQLSQATVGALAGHLDRRLSGWSGPASRPPSYRSYQEYSRALDEFLKVDRASMGRAAELFVDAWRADSTFTAPLIWAIFALWNSGQGERADSLAHALEPRSASMPEWDRAMLRYHLAFMHGSLGAQYRAAAEVVRLAPDSEWRYLLALAAKQVGCRDEALSVLQDLGTRSGWMDRWSPVYWNVRLDTRHLLGDSTGETHDAEMALEQLTDEIYPGDEYRALAAHIRAAAASGSKAKLEGYLGQVRGLGGRAHRLYMKLLAWGPFELASDRPEYRVVMDSARAWYADRTKAERDAGWYRFAQWVVAYRSGDWHGAREEALGLVESGWPGGKGYQFGPLAVIAARSGEAERARALLRLIPPVEHGRAYADYDPDFFRARVEAILGNPAEAVQYLRAANRKGIPYEEVQGMARIDFELMWDYPPLQRLLAGHTCQGT